MIDKMQQVVLDKDFFTSTHPKEEGKFLWRSDSDHLSLITVYKVPATSEYGLGWREYYAVAGHRGRNVEHLRGTFMKIEVR